MQVPATSVPSSSRTHTRSPSSSSASSSSSPTPAPAPKSITLPDLVSDCPFPLRRSPLHARIHTASAAWLTRGANLSLTKQRALHGLRCGLLTALTYPAAPEKEMRVVCDFLNYLFHLDNISDAMGDAGTLGTGAVVIACLEDPAFRTNARVGRLTKDYWRRLAPTAAPGTQRRFIHTFALFFRAITQQASDRAAGAIPDLESYIALRRDTSGCRPCWALIEYAMGLDIPDAVMAHEALATMGEAANDLVTWSNDIFSYNVEQARGDTHNMVVIAMHQHALPLQAAVDFVGALCRAAIARFVAAKARLPSFASFDADGGAEGRVDRDVATYVRGLEDWIVGSLHWSFESERYFGKAGRAVKKTRVVPLLPRRPSAAPTSA